MSTEVTPEVGSVTLGSPPAVNNLNNNKSSGISFTSLTTITSSTDQPTVPGKACKSIHLMISPLSLRLCCVPPFLPETFTFLKYDTFIGFTQSQFHIFPKTFTFFKSNVMTLFKGYTPTLLVFFKSFLSQILFPELFFSGFTQLC